MQHLLKTVIPFATALIFSSCTGTGSSENKSETTGGHDHAATEQTQNLSSATPVLKNNKLNAVYQHYIHLTTALTNSDIAESKVAANAIEAGAKNMADGKPIASSAAKITAATNIEAERAAYETLSNNLIALIKKDGLLSGELYVAHCSMAFNDKGASWISGSKEISNPYFGQKMLGCGDVRETIK